MTKLILSTLAVILAGIVFFLYTQPTYDRAGQLKAQINDYDQALDKAQQLLQLRDSLMKKLNDFKPSDVDRLQKMLPDHVDNVRLILDLDNLAQSLGLTLQNVNIANEGAAPQNAAIGAIGADTKKYDSLTFSFTVNATYEKFLTFLDDLQSSLRLIDITSLTINPGPGTVIGPSGPEPLYAFNMEFQTYWLK